MDRDICRICLDINNLSPIFVKRDQSDRYSAVLGLTTGLKIKIDDGLPQTICANCIQSVNNAIKLRNTSHYSEIKLLKMGYRRNKENIIQNIEINENKSNFEEIFTDCFDFDGFKIEIELDRVSENGAELQDGANNTFAAKELTKQPIKKSNRNDKRKMYLDMVDGEYDPKKPVKCKICKQSVSKWACFINHAKKHLGFKFVCEFCGKSFISSNQLKRHCRSFHGLERELKCRYCSYLALDKAQLVVHERRTHTGERPYICDTCSAAYFSRKCLIQHLESHRVKATVQCDQCSAQLKSRRHLAKHKYGAHGQRRARRRKIQTLHKNLPELSFAGVRSINP